MRKTVIEWLKKLECFREGDFVLKSGKKSGYYMDLKKATSDPETVKSIIDMIYEKLLHVKNYKIIGVPYGGIPYAYCLSYRYDIPCLMMRKEQKKYGTKNLIEGNYSKNDSIVIIEDVLTTGKSLTESLEHLKDFKIEKIIVIVDREEGGKEKLESLGYSIESIFSIKDFKN